MADDIITAFPPYYDEVPMSRGNAGWENPPYYLTAYGLAVKHGYTGTEEEWLASLKGDPGPGIVILGHYDTLAALEEAVTEPEDGDMYDVGSGASQLVYYWSDAQEDWLPLNVHGPQGETGPAGADGAPGVDGADGASAYEQAQEAGYSGTEQEFMSLLADLPGYTEQARLWAVAAGEAESSAEGYAEAAAASAAAVGMAASVSYDNTDSGLTATDVQAAIDEVVGDIPSVPAAYTSNPAMDGTASAGSSGSWAKGDHVHPTDTSRQAAIKIGTITLSTTWTAMDPGRYQQTVTVTGATVTANSMITLCPTIGQIWKMLGDGIAAMTIRNVDGVLTALTIGAGTSESMTIACTVTEVV